MIKEKIKFVWNDFIYRSFFLSVIIAIPLFFVVAEVLGLNLDNIINFYKTFIFTFISWVLLFVFFMVVFIPGDKK